MMASTNEYNSRFNTESMMFGYSSSLAVEGDKLMMDPYESSQQHYNSSDDDDEPVVVKQTLDADQKNYEFPPRSLLQELSYLDEDIDSFFDESSFSTSESDYYHNNMNSFSDSSYRLMLSEIMDDDDEYNNDEDDMTDTDDQQLLVDDSRLSPLQLPARASCSPRRRRARDLSCDSTSTVTQIPPPTNPTTDPVGPSSFLKHQQSSPLLSCNTKKNNNHGNRQQDHFTHPKNGVIQRKGSSNNDSRRHQVLSQLDSEDELDLPIFRNESEPIMDDISETDSDDIRYNNNSQSSHSRTILIKLSSSNRLDKKKDRCYSRVSSSYHISDEGYEEDEECMDDDNELPIDSVSVFLPLSDQEQEQMVDRDVIRNAAATRIQAAWRGYQSRRDQKQLKSALKPTQRLMVDLARICSHMHGRQVGRMNQRMDELEQRLREEQAMRMAFEKAMEDMTILIDQQQKMLSDRIDGEIMMRETFEQKMLQAESRIKKEVKARNDLECSMSQILVQVQDMQQAQQRQVKEDADTKKMMSRKLDDALYEINILKRQQQQQQQQQQHNNNNNNNNNNNTTTTKVAASMAMANNTTTTTITTNTTNNTNNTNNRNRNNNKSSTASSLSSASASNNKASSLSSASMTKASTPRTTATSIRTTNTTTTASSRRRTIVPSSNKTTATTQVIPNPRTSSRMEAKRPTAVPRTSSRQSTQTLTTRRSTIHQRR